MEILLGIFVIYMIIIIIRKKKHRNLLNDPIFIQLQHESRDFIDKIDKYRNEYFVNSNKELIKGLYRDTYNKLSKNKAYLRINNEIILKFVEIYSNLDNSVKKWNEEYIFTELKSNEEYFGNIDGKSLDEQQRRAVVVDEDNNIIVASAGSGKTLTISGKVKYLVEKKNINPDDILLISFTKKSTEEMQERIENRLNISVKTKTFHALGYEILMKTNSFKPDVSNYLNRVVNNYFKNIALSDNDMINTIIKFFGYYLNIPKDLNDFDSLGEVHDQVKGADFETIKSKVERKKNNLKKEKITLKGEEVKSQEEVIIANFLYLNGINYEYEKVYPFQSDEKYRKQYRPDFYLTDYDLYLEHFGITRDYRTPWLSEIESTKYIDGVKWKREIHKNNKTKLLETYSYYNSEGILITKLEEIIVKNKILTQPPNYKEIYKWIFVDEERYFKEFKKLIATFIGLFKSSGYSISSFDDLNKEISIMDNLFLKERAKIFISIIKPIYKAYQDQLNKNQMIDFNDMINLATESVRTGNIKLNYKYIIIDEYQDISVSRYNLVKAIKDQTGAKITAVGDDFQSIYRFTGSDIGLFTNFKKYFGYSEILKIERTYRNSQELIDTSGRFIMKNKNQITKSLISNKRHSNPIRILGYFDISDMFEKAINEIIFLHGEQTDIMVIGRTNFDIEMFRSKEERDNNFKNKEDFKPITTASFLITKENEQIIIKYKKYPDLYIFFTTAHKSKGLEAENVIIINLENKLLGFPNKISDDPLLSLVLTDKDDYIYAEERRIFYVALTRTKNSCYLLVPDLNKSLFVEELIKEHSIRYEVSGQEESITKNPNCPKCQTGILVLRQHSTNSSKFLGCTHYPLCDYTISNIELLNDQIICPSCGGYMVKRRGKFGEFYGCTNFPYCNRTINIDKIQQIPNNYIGKTSSLKSKEEPNKAIINTAISIKETYINSVNSNNKKYNSEAEMNRKFNKIKQRVANDKDMFMFDAWLGESRNPWDDIDMEQLKQDALDDAMSEWDISNNPQHKVDMDGVLREEFDLDYKNPYIDLGKLLEIGDNYVNGERIQIDFEILENSEIKKHISDFEYEVIMNSKNGIKCSVTKLGISHSNAINNQINASFTIYDIGTSTDLMLGWISSYRRNTAFLNVIIKNSYEGASTDKLIGYFFDKIEVFTQLQGFDHIVTIINDESGKMQKDIQDFLLQRGYENQTKDNLTFELNLIDSVKSKNKYYEARN